jgi:hypothetical protein
VRAGITPGQKVSTKEDMTTLRGAIHTMTHKAITMAVTVTTIALFMARSLLEYAQH